MKFVIITHVQHIKKDNQYYGYAPYIREMNIWLKHVKEVVVVAPLIDKELNPIHEKYNQSNLDFIEVPEFNITSIKRLFKTIILLPIIFYKVYAAMKKADHIHLRCPGNMGLIGVLVQIAFPKKIKTAKYAGNWDPKAKQPFTYKLQKWVLSNTFLTKNMQVLVYGEWPNQSKNIKPFFTATYSQQEILNSEFRIQKDDVEGTIRFLFVGTLSPGKQPIYAIKLVEELYKKRESVILEIYGDGILREEANQYINENNLQKIVFLKGNQSKEIVLRAYQDSHFLLLPSKSEGWPKVVAEAMVWGCVPIATKVSCVPYMLDYSKRGLLLTENLKQDVYRLGEIIDEPKLFNELSALAQEWSIQFTTDKFEEEIKKLL